MGQPPQFVKALETGLLRAGADFSQPLLLAVSGGPDSTALLLGCCALRDRTGMSIAAAHFNHELRSGAGGDARFVEDLCSTLGVSFTGGAEGVALFARRERLSVEQAARDLRYAFLARASAQARAQGVATGHTLDDQAETVLLHLVRGSGTRGLAGMRPRSVRTPAHGAPALTVLRPMLGISHADALGYCRARGVAPRSDPTNRDIKFARNRIRLRVLPEMVKLNPEAVRAIARMANAAADDSDALEATADVVRRRALRRPPAEFDRRQLVAAHPALARRLLVTAFEAVAGTAEALESSHLAAMLAAAAAGAGRSLDLPHGVKFETTHAIANLTPTTGSTQATSALPASVPEFQVVVPGVTGLPGGIVIEASVVARPRSPSGSGATVHVEAGLARAPLLVRSRRRGDRFHPLGMPGPAKLQDFFTGQHVARELRDRAPLVEGPHGIVWVAGYRIAEWAKVPRGAKRALKLEIRPSPV